MTIQKIISGGQTGVDQASLLIAKEVGITIGGWCPKGGLDENNHYILDRYPLRETVSANSDERTVLNIQDADGTLIIVPSWPLSEKIKDGTLLTIQAVQKLKKPYLIIDLSAHLDTNDSFITWINKNNIKIINCAGPRESSSPGVQDAACQLFRNIFPLLLT